VDLVLEPLLGGSALGEQPAPEPHSGQQRILRVVLPEQHGPTRSLPGEVSQRGAVPVVGLEPARPELSASAAVRLNGSTNPAASVLSQTRCATFPGSIATTNWSTGKAL
jgi:hypothetical protein